MILILYKRQISHRKTQYISKINWDTNNSSQKHVQEKLGWHFFSQYYTLTNLAEVQTENCNQH